MSHKINHREVGQGPTLILLHGYGGSVMHWDPVVENLKTHYRVVIPNISHLYLSQDKVFFTVQVEILARYIREHYPHQAVSIAGTSYGGALAWALSSHYPELVDRLVLINPMVPNPTQHFIPPEIRYFCVLPIGQNTLLKMLPTPIGKALLRRMAQAFRTERTRGKVSVDNLKGRKLQFVGHLIYRFTWILKNEDWNYWRNKVLRLRGKKFILMIFDREDYLFSPETYRQFAEELGCISVQEINGAGHLAIKTRPDTISKMIIDFVPNEKAA